MAEWDGPSRTVRIGARHLSEMGREIDMRRLALAHELGHAKQLRDKLGPARMLPDPKEMRAGEAQADAFAVRFLAAAGFSPDTAWNGLAAFIRIMGDGIDSANRAHPVPGARFLNLKIIESRAGPSGEHEPSLERFNDRGILRAELWVPARLNAALPMGTPPLPPGMTEEQFRKGVVDAAEKIIADPEAGRTMGSLALANRCTDLTVWVIRRAVEAVLRGK